jgi:hypothetical protein
VADLRTANAPYTVLSRVRHLYFAAKAMAPERDWGWLEHLVKRLRNSKHPLRTAAVAVL